MFFKYYDLLTNFIKETEAEIEVVEEEKNEADIGLQYSRLDGMRDGLAIVHQRLLILNDVFLENYEIGGKLKDIDVTNGENGEENKNNR